MIKCPLCDMPAETLIMYAGEKMCAFCVDAIEDNEAQREQEFEDSLDYLYDSDGR